MISIITNRIVRFLDVVISDDHAVEGLKAHLSTLSMQAGYGAC